MKGSRVCQWLSGHRRLQGAATGSMTALPATGAIVALGLIIDRDPSGGGFLFALMVAGATLASAAVAGALTSRSRALEPGRRVRWLVVRMSVVAVAIGAYLLAGAMLLPWGLSNDSATLVEWLSWAAYFGTAGLVLFGVPVAILAIPHAFVWAGLMRRWVGA